MKATLGIMLGIVIGYADLASAEVPKFDLTIKDHRFEPARVVIPRDTKVKLLVKNLDSSAEEFESYELNREKIIPGQSEAAVFVGPLAAGTYPFFGEFNPSTAQGVLVVE